MATPSQVRLTVISGSPNSIVEVQYSAIFTAQDVVGNLRFRERICLFGEDPPPGPIGDDQLFCFPPRVIRPGAGPVIVRRRAMVPNTVLDEDPGPEEDEIYAQVCLRPLDGITPAVLRCARSRTISLPAQPEGS